MDSYECSSIENLKKQWEEKVPGQDGTDPTKYYLKTWYECKEDNNTWGPENVIKDVEYIKLGSGLWLIKKPNSQNVI